MNPDLASLARFVTRAVLLGITPYLPAWVAPETWQGFLDVLVPVVQIAAFAWFAKKYGERKQAEEVAGFKSAGGV